MAVNPTTPAAFWDQVYAADDYRYGTRPNAFLEAQVGALRPRGDVLCLGDGEGRNGVWLATQGFGVTTVEQSARAVAKAQALAARSGVRVNAIQATLPDWPIARQSFDAVVLIFLHLPPGLRERVHADASLALRPGGVIVHEAFTPAQLGRPSGGPTSAAALQTAALLRTDFAALEIELLEERETVLAEGPGHHGPAAVVHLLARRRLRSG